MGTVMTSVKVAFQKCKGKSNFHKCVKDFAPNYRIPGKSRWKSLPTMPAGIAASPLIRSTTRQGAENDREELESIGITSRIDVNQSHGSSVYDVMVPETMQRKAQAHFDSL